MRLLARTAALSLALATLTGSASLLLAGSASAGTGYTASSYAGRLLELVNGARRDHGLVSLKLAAGTVSIATDWSQRLADDRMLSHNPNLQADLESHGSKEWTVFGENVGDADSQDPNGLFEAYMASPEHRENVLTPNFRYLGNAVVFAGGRAWNTMDFVDVYASSTTAVVSTPRATPAPSAPPKAAAAPAPLTRISRQLLAPRPAMSPARARQVLANKLAPPAAPPATKAISVPRQQPAGSPPSQVVAGEAAHRDVPLPVAGVAALLALLMAVSWVRVANRSS